MSNFCAYSIVARGSSLSRAQVAELQRLLPHIHFIPHFVESRGDRDRTTSLRDLGKSDFFTRELDELLLNGRVRAALHSAKDLPDPLPETLCLAALTAGVDPRDCVVLKEGVLFEDLTSPVIATSSERREDAVRMLCPKARFIDLRGTIQERLQVVQEGKADGVVLAEAALVRLRLNHLHRIFLPGPSSELQGQLAVVVRKGDEEMMELFRPLDSRGRRHPWTVLYLGLDPESCPVSGRIYHYPVIRTSSLPEGQSRVKQVWSECTHVLFTSKRAVHYLSSSLLWEGKTVLAIGEGTAQALRAFGIEPRVAPIATQEGCLALLQQLDCVNKQICWPRSKNSRDFLERHLPHARIVDLYETNCFSPGAPPLLSEIDEVVFMSPSCVEGFCRIYGTKLPNVKISVQGPITATACRKWFGVDRMAIHQPRDEQ